MHRRRCVSCGSVSTFKGLSTAPFRRAVWYYVLRILGVFHDDYDYKEVAASRVSH